MKMLGMLWKGGLSAKPHIRLGVSVSIIMLVIVGLGAVFLFANRSLFSKNRHFTLKKIEIVGSASWKARKEQILAYGKLKIGESNLFAIDIRELRRKLSELPSVEGVSVSRRLPDTIVITISERLPRVAFNYNGRRFYADAKGVVFSAASYGELLRDLPIVIGLSLPDALAEGDKIDALVAPSAIAVIAAKYFPEFMILRMDVSKAGSITALLRPRKSSESYTVIFPKEDLHEKFAAFKWALEKSLEDGTGKTIFDLRFAGQVVTR